MKNYLILLFIFLSIGSYAQTSIKAVTDEPADLVPPKATGKQPIPITIGDSVTLHTYSVSTKLWQATYKGIKGTLKDTLLAKSYKVIGFKNIFIDQDFRSTMIKKYGKFYGTDLSKGTISLGMTAKMVREVYPKPDNINRTVGSWGVHEQWVYDKGDKSEYLYFENGKLTSWQD
ncbi:hypothetical protein [Mucilaginibacter sp. HD30]